MKDESPMSDAIASPCEILPGSTPSLAQPDVLDLRGEVCPYTFVRTKLALEDLPDGEQLEIWLDHRIAFTSVPRALREDGHQVLSCEIDGDPPLCRIVVRNHAPRTAD